MATTTNYGWTTPDDTALVKDGASAIRTLGSSVDTTTKALNPSTTLGDIEYRSSTANTNTRLGIGTTGQVLTVSGGVPSWATAAGGSGMTLLSTTTPSGTSTTVNITDTGYIDLYVIVTGVTATASNADMAIRYNTVTTGYYGVNMADSRTDNVRVTNATQLDTGVDQSMNVSNTSNLLTFTIPNYANTGYHFVDWQKAYYTDTGVQRMARGIGSNGSTVAISSITFVSAQTINAGSIKVYGVK
jgi:hypothetical protein